MMMMMMMGAGVGGGGVVDGWGLEGETEKLCRCSISDHLSNISKSKHI